MSLASSADHAEKEYEVNIEPPMFNSNEGVRKRRGTAKTSKNLKNSSERETDSFWCLIFVLRLVALILAGFASTTFLEYSCVASLLLAHFMIGAQKAYKH